MTYFALGLSCFALGFVLAQNRYMRFLDRSREREESLHQMLRDSRERYREISDMLAEARRR